jgi:hypothetical protein
MSMLLTQILQWSFVLRLVPLLTCCEKIPCTTRLFLVSKSVTTGIFALNLPIGAVFLIENPYHLVPIDFAE